MKPNSVSYYSHVSFPASDKIVSSFTVVADDFIFLLVKNTFPYVSLQG